MSSRNQVADTVKLIIPPPRIRMHLDTHGMNYKVVKELIPIKDELNTIKKEGAPVDPEKLTGEVTEEQRDEYKASHKEYTSYASEEYQRLQLVHSLYKNLTNLTALLERRSTDKENDKKFSANNKAKLSKLQDTIRDEGDEPVGYADYTG